jgi:PKD repeat protein
MRSFRLMAATTVILAGAWACGSDSNGPSNTSPVANFTAPACTVSVACTFTDASSDPDGTIASRSWDFGDGTTSQDANPTHTFAAAQTYQVTLTVTDNGGATNAKTVPVIVTGGTGNQPPVASFDLPACTAGTPCGFHSTSTDPDGTIATAHWDFGDGAVADGLDVTHSFDAANTYNVKLTVTDNLGATAEVTHALTVTPAASQDCTTSGTLVDCVLTVTQRSTITIAVVSRSCELGGNKLSITAPRPQTAFFNLCSSAIGDTYTVTDAGGAPLVFEAGSQMSVRFTQGLADAGDPIPGDPGIQVDGTSPNWTLNIDDGGNPTGGSEPDFNDAILSVTATAAP